MKKATRFMRKPFFVDGHQVTEEDMEFIAEWCQGTVIPNNGKPFIRVPVVNAKSSRQSEARVDMWILKSLQGGRDTFKIYSEEWLDKSFDQVPGVDDEPEERNIPNKEVSNNVRALRPPPQRPGPTPAMFSNAKAMR